MFYNNQYSNDLVPGLGNFLNNTYTDKNDFGLYREKFLSDRFGHILKMYDEHEEYIKNLIKDFKKYGINSSDIESQILDLFNNVRVVFLKEDREMIENCIKSISIGEENVCRFLEDHKENMDKGTLHIMTSILNEYRYHMMYLNEAIRILK